MCKISVIVPVYRAEDYLDQCVRSILLQTFSDFELFLVDDGSPDNCSVMCDAWAQRDSRVRVIHKENGGPMSAVAEGVRSSKGEWLTFVDSDDWVEPTFLITLYEGAIETGADIVQCNLQRVDEFGRKFSETSGEPIVYDRMFIRNVLQEEMAQNRLGALNGSRCNKLYKNVVVKAAVEMCPQHQMCGEDFLMNFAAVTLSERVAMLDTPSLYHYRYNEASITNSYNPRKRLQEYTFWQTVYNIARSAGCKDLPDVEKQIQRSHVNTIYECSISNWTRRAKKEEIRILLAQITDRKLLLREPKNDAPAKRICLAMAYMGMLELMLWLVDVYKQRMNRR